MADGFHHKIVELSRLLEQVRQARHDGKVVVQCHGCFDIVHPGHIRYLQFARQLGDLLVVSLTADAAISKRATSPYIPQELRAESLAALELVDYVYVDPSPTAESVLDAVRPDIYVKGAEYESSREPGFLREHRIVESYGGRVIFSSGETVFSSTRLLQSLPQETGLEAQRRQLIQRRHGIDSATLLDAIDRFPTLRVAVIGDIVLDRYVFCDPIDVATESPMMALARLRDEAYVGGAGIVARHVAAMGATPFLLSAVPSDEAAKPVTQVLDDEGVECCFLESHHALPEKVRYLVEEKKLLKVENATRVPLDSHAERRAARALRDRLPDFDAVILCDFGYGMITTGLMNRVIPALREHATILAGDVSGSRGNLLAYQDADLLCPTEREVRATLHDFDRGLSTVAWDLMDRTQAKRMIVTLGNRGLVTFQRRSTEPDSPEWSGRLLSEHLPTFAEHCLDLLGCGDALLAIATMGLASGLSFMQSAWLGNTAAAVQGSQLGNIPVRPRPLRDRILCCTGSGPTTPESPQPVPAESTIG